MRDQAFLRTFAPAMAEPLQALKQVVVRHLVALRSLAPRWKWLSPAQIWQGFVAPAGTTMPPGALEDWWAEEQSQLQALAATAADPSAAGAADALSRLVSWPTAAGAAYLEQACVTATSQAYAMHALALRSGIAYATWEEWRAWFRQTAAAAATQRQAALNVITEYRNELRQIWLSEQARDAVLEAAVIDAVAARARLSSNAVEFVGRWEQILTPAEAEQILDATGSVRPLIGRHQPPPLPAMRPAVIPPPLPGMAAKAQESRAQSKPQAAPEPRPVVKEEPSVWDQHLKPFLAAHWYIIAGLLMVVAGASLVAYFTWDKSVLVRYLLMPVILAGFTGGMAELGLRLARRHDSLRASGTFLLGGAVCLLPVNFMVLCRAGDDPQAAAWLLPAFVLYTAMAGCGLWRWCGAVQAELRQLLALPLLAVNLLAVIGDMPGVRELASSHRSTLLPCVLTAAMLLLFAVSNRFFRRILTKELLEAKLVPWFFGITLAITNAQVFVWRHFHLHISPHPQDYALAAILLGATLLRWERRACELRNRGAAYGGESFLGYAALMLGILMGAGSQWLRIITLLLVGAIWLVQAPRRPGVVHYWIGKTFCLLGGAAFGMLDSFPKSRELNLLPALGLALALCVGAARAVAGRLGKAPLRQVMVEIQPPILLLTSIVAVLSQYNLRSTPWHTGIALLAIGLVFAVRATRENREDWLNITAVGFGLALPYLGCADMVAYRFDQNTLALGFGLLAAVCLGAARLLPGSAWQRSDAVVVFGTAGMLGLGLRLILANRPEITGVEIVGGVLLAVSLGIAAWRSGARLPAMMASATLAVILPLFRVAGTSVWLGTGLPSATCALLLMFGCFALRRIASNGRVDSESLPPATGSQRSARVFVQPTFAALFWLSGKALLFQFQEHIQQWPFITSSLFVAATFYLAAIYFRRQPVGRILFHASWPLLAASIYTGCYAAGCRGAGMLQYPALWTGVALTLWVGAESLVARKLDWVRAYLVLPRLRLLAYGSALVALLVAWGIQIPNDDSRFLIDRLALFVAAQLVWHGLLSSQRRFGAVLFVLACSWLCFWWEFPVSFGALPLLLLSVFAIDIVLEFLPKSRAFFAALRAPFVAGATMLATGLLLVAVVSVMVAGGDTLQFSQARPQLLMVLVAVLLAARIQACAGFVLPAVALGYLLCRLPCEFSDLFSPWRLACIAVSLCLLVFPARLLSARWPRLLKGSASQLPTLAGLPQAPWLVVSGLVLAIGAATIQIVSAASGQAQDPHWVQTFAPFAAVFAFAAAARYWRQLQLWAVAGFLLPLANLFAISVMWANQLLGYQLTALHIIGIAAVLTIGEFAIARWFALRSTTRPEDSAAAANGLHQGSVALAGLTLLLLGVNYLAHSDLAEIPALRFVTSGLLALGAGIYFRAAARRPEILRTTEGVWMESLWHVALGLALWCGALLIPQLRTPGTALYALALPALACWGAAQWFLRIKTASEENIFTGSRFRSSAASFAVLILVLYVFRLPFQMVLFPGAPLDLQLYHGSAAVALLMGVILIHCRGLGAAPWAAFVGGLALITGLYFNITWIPGLSPFVFPMAGAWVAVGFAHLLILLSFQQSPLRSLLQHMGNIGAEEWHAHRIGWGLYLTLAFHFAAISALLTDYDQHSLETTPLLIALASVLIHQVALGSQRSRAYWALAVIEILAALHFDFILPASSPGLIPAKQVVWFLLSLWLATGMFWRHFKARLDSTLIWAAAGCNAVLCLGHMFYHGPATGPGLVISALIALAALLTPLPTNAVMARSVATLLLLEPLWLAYFATRWGTGDDATAFRPLLAAVAALLATGVLVRLVNLTNSWKSVPELPANLAAQPEVPTQRLWQVVLEFCGANNETVARNLLASAFGGLAIITCLYSEASHGSLGLMLGLAFLWSVCCGAWFHEGRLRDGVSPYLLSVLSLAGGWVVMRRLLFAHFDFWAYEYDVWLSLGASIGFSAAKRLIKEQHPGLDRTVTGTIWLLPVLQCVWLLSSRLSADLTLLVIGVQSMLFAWQGGGKRDSPYNAVSMLGFVFFVCLLFWAKLDLRCVQAYTIPVGLGVLALVWLFGKHLPSALRNSVRLVTVITMLGSCGYYALLDNSYPLAFHLTMLFASLTVMALGPVLRVQLYLYLGFVGFAIDLVALVVKQFGRLDRSIQMAGVGSLLLLLGIAVVGGAILYKTHHELIAARLAAIRARLGGWE